MKHAKIIFLLTVIVAISGCTIPSDLFGKREIKVDVKTTEEGFRDILVLKDIKTIPTSPVLPDQQMILTFIIENRDKEKVARDVKAVIFDSSAFRQIGLADQCYDDSHKCTILPGEQKMITFNLRAPTMTQTGGVKISQRISFRVEYVYTGATLQDVLVVKLDEIISRMRQGETISLKKEDVHGSGPLQIMAGIKGAEYTLPDLDATFEFTIMSKGDKSQGSVRDSRIGPRGFSITFPRSMFGSNTKIISPGGQTGTQVSHSNDDVGCNCINSQTCSSVQGEYTLVAGYKQYSGPVTRTNPCETNGQGNCSLGMSDGNCLTDSQREALTLTFHCSEQGVCWNVKSIPLYKGDSIPLLFRITRVGSIQEPYRTFSIRANVEYTYELRNSVDIVVNPFN